jgi:hypothetical protein
MKVKRSSQGRNEGITHNEASIEGECDELLRETDCNGTVLKIYITDDFGARTDLRYYR